MPSSKRSSKRSSKNDDFALPMESLTPRTPSQQHGVVMYEKWIEHNEDHLLRIYETLQEFSATTGRCVFDQNTCSFPLFCQLAYTHSSKYKKHDPDYEADPY